jgi:hypothetical protein
MPALLGAESRVSIARRDKARLVSDLVYQIVQSFELRTNAPHGVSLEVDGFFLPPGQPITVLRDDDVVR